MSSSRTLLARPPTDPGSFAAHAFRIAGRCVRAVVTALLHRRQVTSMLELDDRMLKDVGLVRADVLGALAGPMMTDPSMLLSLRAVDHRARQRQFEAYARRMTVG